ncbi:MAG: DNA methylase [Oscillospiraceae bacterium]|nr:DNA methylase [Oscillospiraceae bacterium]
MKQKSYIAIDLKSFYASVECIQLGLDPMKANLVVADGSRTEKTICLAVSPALKSFGIPGRPRLFEVIQKVGSINEERRRKAPGKQFRGSSINYDELRNDPALEVDYIVAPPRMALYMETSTSIYNIYLKYISPEDIHVYSIDEVFIDATPYLNTYQMTPRSFAQMLLKEILETCGITAAAGIGTNLYLCKVAMDIVAKHIPVDDAGMRIAELDDVTYRRLLWDHRPLTDFWRVGTGYTKKLEKHGLYTMGDIARCSLGEKGEFYSADMLYSLFGINAELLIDHAWGYEPCTIADIKGYRPESNSLGSGQVLHCAYTAEKAKLVIREMTDLLVLDLVEKGLVTDQVVLTVGYDIENLSDPERSKRYHGPVTTDRYGRMIPKHAHGTENLGKFTSSGKEILDAVSRLFDRIVNTDLLVRRMNIVANHITAEDSVPKGEETEQLDLFSALENESSNDAQREKRRQEAVLSIRRKFGKNAILRGMNLEEGATAKDRNSQIGGHKA